MPDNQKIEHSSSNNSSSFAGLDDRNSVGISLNSFKVKPAGTEATINTLIENDSLSSYSLPEDTNQQNGANRQSGSIQDSKENIKNRGATIAPKVHIVIDIENDHNIAPLQEPTYLEAYMKFMYWTCVSPFNPARSQHYSTSPTSDWVLNIIQKICFSTIIGFSFIKSFFQVKFFVLYYMTHLDMENFIDMMFYIMNFGTKIYYVYLFVMVQKQLSEMLESINNLRAFRVPRSHSHSSKNFSTSSYAVKLGISSIIMSLIQTILSSGIINWTPQEGILFHSYFTANGLLVWTKEHMKNDTLSERIEDEYGSELSTTNILLGVFGIVMHFCSCLHNEATGDLIQTQAETVREEMLCLKNQISKTGNDKQNICLDGFFRENGEWKHSYLLSQALKSCNDTMDPIMKLKHVNNLMLYVFFVLNFLDEEYSLALLAHLLYDICKSSYTYRIAAEASTLNESKKDWIRRLAWKSNDKAFLKRVPLLLEEVKEKPEGMGKGQFMIDEGFLYRFLGWVGSVFVLQAQSREAKTE